MFLFQITETLIMQETGSIAFGFITCCLFQIENKSYMELLIIKIDKTQKEINFKIGQFIIIVSIKYISEEWLDSKDNYIRWGCVGLCWDLIE